MLQKLPELAQAASGGVIGHACHALHTTSLTPVTD